jgi:mannose-6-phosphate isomerase-like protein (cupin superfamily)
VLGHDASRAALDAGGPDEAAQMQPPTPALPGGVTQGATDMSAINRDDLPSSGLSHNFGGYLSRDAPASLIFFNGRPGSGPKLLRHPFAEVFVVQQERAACTVSDATIEASGGQFLLAPVVVPHIFVNTGSGRQRQIDIHTSDRFVYGAQVPPARTERSK